MIHRRKIFVLLLLATLSPTGAWPARAAHQAGSYADDRAFLEAHTKVIELYDGEKSRVLVCPDWQARVMTSTCEGTSGASFGWINRSFISQGQPSQEFNNYGGEDRFWISPEAGQFAFFFAPGVEQHVKNWLTPPGLNEGPFTVAEHAHHESCRLTRRLRLINASKNAFEFDVTRTVKIIRRDQFAGLFGPEAGKLAKDAKTSYVGFATENAIVNRGPALTRDKGLASIWTLGQFKPGPRTVIIVPFRTGSEQELGPVVTPDYFGAVPPARLKVTDGAVLFLGDGEFRAKLGVSPRRAKPVGGSYNFDDNVLTLVSYTLPRDASKRLYINNRWELPQAEPFVGDVFNSYNDGPAEPGAKTLGGFYELETLSPTLELAPNEALTHTHRTFHLRGEPATLAKIAKAVLGVDLEEVRGAMLK